eukprot:6101829-Alexandrium_andersonii.AAC.1
MCVGSAYCRPLATWPEVVIYHASASGIANRGLMAVPLASAEARDMSVCTQSIEGRALHTLR